MGQVRAACSVLVEKEYLYLYKYTHFNRKCKLFFWGRETILPPYSGAQPWTLQCAPGSSGVPLFSLMKEYGVKVYGGIVPPTQ